MPVQIPELKRFAPQEEASVGRVQAQVPDGSQGQAQVTKAVSGLASTAVSFFEKVEDDTAKLEGLKARNDYELKFKEGLAAAKKIEGNPTAAYAKLEEDSKTWENEIFDSHAGSSNRVRYEVQQGVTKARYLLQDQKITSETTQYAIFDKNESEAGVKLRQDMSLASIGNVDVSKTPDGKLANPNSWNNFLENINEMDDVIINRAIRNGNAIRDEKGGLNLSRQTVVALKEAKGVAIENAVITLNHKGKTEEALYLIDRYKDDIPGGVYKKLVGDHKTATDTHEGLVLAEKLMKNHPDSPLDAYDKIKDMKGVRVEVKHKAEEFINARSLQVSGLKKREGDMAFEDVAKELREMAAKGDRPVSFANFANTNRMFMERKNRLQADDVGKIKKMIEKPEVSDHKTLMNMYKLSSNPRGFSGMPLEEFEKNAAGLDESKWNTFLGKWEADNKTSNPEQQKLYTELQKIMGDQLVESKLAKKKNGDWVDEGKVVRHFNEVWAKADTLPVNASVKDVHTMVRQYVTKVAKDGAFKSEFEGFQGGASTSKPKNEEQKEASAFDKLPTEIKAKWVSKWSSETKETYNADKRSDVKKFFDSKGGKL